MEGQGLLMLILVILQFLAACWCVRARALRRNGVARRPGVLCAALPMLPPRAPTMSVCCQLSAPPTEHELAPAAALAELHTRTHTRPTHRPAYPPPPPHTHTHLPLPPSAPLCVAVCRYSLSYIPYGRTIAKKLCSTVCAF